MISTSNIIVSTPIGPGSIMVDGGITSWSSLSSMIEFFEFVLSVLGYDITYDEFTKMTKSEKDSILRDIKIKRILDVNN